MPELLSELFSEQLGYPITPTDIGLEATDEHEVGLRYSGSITTTVVAVGELGKYDVRRHSFLRHGTFLIQALRLTQESGDTALGAHVLAGMSDQARMLGYPRETLQLAITGRHGLARAHSPACAVRLLALQARAHAALGEIKQAAHAVVKSEHALEHVDTGAEPE